MVEHHLAKVGVAGSSPVFRSIVMNLTISFTKDDFGAKNVSMKS